MSYVLIRHRVEDYDRWRPAFDAHGDARRAAGLEDLNLWRSADDPNELVILFRAEDEARAKAFAASEDLQQIMREAGVVGAPEMHFLHEEDLGPQKKVEVEPPRIPL